MQTKPSQARPGQAQTIANLPRRKDLLAATHHTHPTPMKTSCVPATTLTPTCILRHSVLLLVMLVLGMSDTVGDDGVRYWWWWCWYQVGFVKYYSMAVVTPILKKNRVLELAYMGLIMKAIDRSW